MNNSSSSNIGGDLKEKRHNSFLHNRMPGKRIKIDYSHVDLLSILSKSKINSASQSSSSDHSKHQYFTNLKMNSRVRVDSDSFKINSENKDSFQQLMVGNNENLERRPLSELQVFSPDSHSIYSDDRMDSEASSPACSEPIPLLSDSELSPDYIDSSESKKNIENDPSMYVLTKRYSNIQNSVGSTIVTSWSKFRDIAISQKPVTLNERPCPLPEIPWGKNSAFWQMLYDRDSATLTYRNPGYKDYHEDITHRKRAIVLDWLIDVSSCYNLQRETYYLALDYLDRYLSSSDSIPTQKLQLIGITCLFMAAKMEEIHPPKLSHFSYITDGQCTDEDLLDMEKTLLMNLGFHLSPISINYWMELMLQLSCVNDSTAEESLIFPQFPRNVFNQISNLLDLVSLDSTSLRYSYSELALSALTIVLSKKILLTISDLSERNICDCVEWMSVIWSVILEEYQYEEIDFQNISELVDGTHIKQQHLVSMDMYDSVQSRFRLIQLSQIKSPVTPSNILTPPLSAKKYPATPKESPWTNRFLHEQEILPFPTAKTSSFFYVLVRS